MLLPGEKPNGDHIAKLLGHGWVFEAKQIPEKETLWVFKKQLLVARNYCQTVVVREKNVMVFIDRDGPVVAVKDQDFRIKERLCSFHYLHVGSIYESIVSANNKVRDEMFHVCNLLGELK